MDNNQEKTNPNVLHNINTQNVGGFGRRRGHQHHIRHNGSRTSNIEADEILAALRRGDQMPITETFRPSLDHIDIDLNLDDENLLDDDKQQLFFNDTRTTTTNQNTNRKSSSDKKHVDCINLIDDDDDDDDNSMTVSTNPEATSASNNNNNIGTQITALPHGSNVSINISNSDKSTKTKRSKRGETTQSDVESNTNRDITRKKFRKLSPMEERPPLEGADSDYWTENSGTDVENDPEAAEWLKLRCTSERTEVIAEREYRRQNRRCADYPGLAFGRSIFSSDTMMKLNIIRNELHNIMKTQLKRVRVVLWMGDAACMIEKKNTQTILH